MDETVSGKQQSNPDRNASNWEVSLLGERFRLKPSGKSNSGTENPESEQMAQEAIAWVGRQLAAAEARLVNSPAAKPKAHHVALLALVELAHEAMVDRNRHAQALDGLVAKLEKLKSKREAPKVQVSTPDMTSIPLEVIEQAEAAWLRDEPVPVGTPSAHS